MKCFYYFKHKSISSGQKSGLEMRSSDTLTVESTSKISTSIGSSVSSRQSISALYEEKARSLRAFSFPELRDATNGFSKVLKIGEGGFGSVYKGYVRPANGAGDRFMVAIKKHKKSGLQGHKQWIAEVQFLGVVEHPNLVKLVGYCALDDERGTQRLLVYEFMSNRSLEDHLFKRDFPVLPWNQRLEIILGAAQGLAYLHEDLEVQVIYRDFKASNILLDENFKPKLSDFGLAREGPLAGHTHVSTEVLGTYGYAAPDYIETGHLTTKSDVWSFGVVLYELLSGRQSVEKNRPKDEQKLLDWVKQFHPESRKLKMIIDPRLGNDCSLSAARVIAKLANRCLSKHPKERPKMSEVVHVLKQAIQISETGDVSGDPPIESTAIDNSDITQNSEQISSPKYSTKRMLHLAKLRDHENAISMRRFKVMQKVKELGSN